MSTETHSSSSAGSGGSSVHAPKRVSLNTFLGVIWAVTAVSFLFLIVRVAIRVRTFRKLFTDDYLAIVAWLLLLTSSITWQAKMHLLYWQYDVSTGKTPYSPEFLAAYATFMPYTFVWTVLYFSCLWAVKFSFLMFFRRLGSTVRAHRIWWWIVFGFLVAGWIITVFDYDYNCSLKNIKYIMTQCGHADHISLENQSFYISLAIDILSDLLVISIPFTILWKVQIPRRRKLILFAIFSASILIIVASIIRITLIRGTESQSQEASIDWLWLWSAVEMSIAIIVSCVASFHQFFKATRNKQRHDDQGQSHARLRHLGFLTYLGFSRLSLRSDSRRNRDVDNSDVPSLPKRSGSLDSDSQTHIMPLASVHVKRSFEVSNSLAPPPVKQNRIYDGYEVV